MAGSILGTRVQRKEDPKFLTTGGVYVDDLTDELLAGALHVVYARSAVAHGTILSIDIDGAKDMPGVVGVFTAESLGLEPVAVAVQPDGRAHAAGQRQGPLRRRTGRRRRRRNRGPGHRRRRDGRSSTSTSSRHSIDIEAAAASETLIYEAAGIERRVRHHARSACPRTPPPTTTSPTARSSSPADSSTSASPRARSRSAARPPPGSTVGSTSGCRPSTRRAPRPRSPPPTASSADQVRVITPDVGGGFGAKIGTYPEELLLGPISKALGRPVRWRETRSESMMGLGHGRAQVQYVTIGGTRDGKVTHYQLHAPPGLRARSPTSARVLALAMTRPMASARVRHPEHRVPRHLRRHEHDPDRALPRRRTARGDRRGRAGDGHVRRRDRQGRRRGPPHEPDPEVPRTAHHRDRPRPTTSATSRARSTRRSRQPATPSCAPSRPVDARPATTSSSASA